MRRVTLILLLLIPLQLVAQYSVRGNYTDSTYSKLASQVRQLMEGRIRHQRGRNMSFII